jgi:hypothetical protein
MNNKRLPLPLELAKPMLLDHSEFDPKTQLSSKTTTTNKSSTFNLAGVLSDIAVDVAVDDVIA